MFDSGAEISCMIMETVGILGLISQITQSSVSVNTASRQNMGVAGNLYVSFKIGKKHSFPHRFMVCDRLSRPFILGEDFLSKHHMTLDWAPEKKHALGYRHDITTVVLQAVTDELLKLRNAIKIPVRCFVLAQPTVNRCLLGKPWL